MNSNADYAVLRLPKEIREKYRRVAGKLYYKTTWQSMATKTLETMPEDWLIELATCVLDAESGAEKHLSEGEVTDV